MIFGQLLTESFLFKSLKALVIALKEVTSLTGKRTFENIAEFVFTNIDRFECVKISRFLPEKSENYCCLEAAKACVSSVDSPTR